MSSATAGNRETVASAAEPVWPQLQMLQIRIESRWLGKSDIPPQLMSNILRGAVGITMRQLVCPPEWMNHECQPCQLYANCAYGQTFMPSPRPDARQLRLMQDTPRPFVLLPPGLPETKAPGPEMFCFELLLMGDAMARLPYFMSTLNRLAHDGLGRDRTRFQIEKVSALHPLGEETLMTSGSSTVRLPSRCLTTAELIAQPWPQAAVSSVVRSPLAARARSRLLGSRGSGQPEQPEVTSAEHRSSRAQPVHSPAEHNPAEAARPRLKIEFLTPLSLKSGSGIDASGRRIQAREVCDRPPMGVIIRRLRDRAAALCTFFGQEIWQHPDFAGLGTLADQVQLIESHTTWHQRNRRSTRTGHSHEISGLTGHALYEFPDRATYDTLAPLLKIGQRIHLGKNTVWGNGAIRCAEVAVE